jgi:tellurite resistance protein TerC
VLIFVGLKMVWLNEWYGGKFPITLSLGVIATIIGVSVTLSLLFPGRDAKGKNQPSAPF